MDYDLHQHGAVVTAPFKQLIAKKVAKLDRRLSGYHADAARLEVQLKPEGQAAGGAKSAGGAQCALTLHAFQGQLHVNKEASDLREAVDRAFDALLKEVETRRARVNKALRAKTSKSTPKRARKAAR